ncbi:MAG: DUF2202 domain-containing protein [Bacteroidetes bacterium]|nr:DUF2202 domain-containing protein [Bacteroidota bacterium]
MRKVSWNLFVKSLLSIGFLFLFTQCENGMANTTGDSTQDDLVLLRDGGEDENEDNPICKCIEEKYPSQELSQEEIQALNLMREEEKLARDVYKALSEKWTLPIFRNISKSEQWHMDMLLCLVNKYDELSDPVGDNPEGEFADEHLQELYNTLVESGLQSLNNALLVGAKIEDLDIADLMELSGNIDNEDILAVFKELTKGSRNHMRAFTRILSRREVTYQPEFISQELFNSILEAEHERGGDLCGGCIFDNQDDDDDD